MGLCAWCQVVEPEQGDIYCSGCRSAVVRDRETGSYAEEIFIEYDEDE